MGKKPQELCDHGLPLRICTAFPSITCTRFCVSEGNLPPKICTTKYGACLNTTVNFIETISMQTNRPSYILAPNWDFQPDGDIRLGSIIKDPKCPDRSLNSESRIEPNPVTKTTKPDWSLTRRDLLSLNGGLATTFLAPLVGIGGDVAGNAFRSEKSRLTCQKLETQYFSPGDTYIANSLCGTAVRAYTKKHYWKSVYMITGLKIAHGLSIETEGKTSSGASVAVRVDATPLAGIPVGEEPHAGFERSHEHAVAFGLCDDPIIIGYRLLKITPKSGGDFKDRPFNKFALLSDEQDVELARQEAVELLHQAYDISDVREQNDIGEGGTIEVWCAAGLFDDGVD